MKEIYCQTASILWLYENHFIFAYVAGGICMRNPVMWLLFSLPIFQGLPRASSTKSLLQMFSINHLEFHWQDYSPQERQPCQRKLCCMAKMGLPRKEDLPGEILGLGEVLMGSPSFSIPYRMLWVKVGAWYWMAPGCKSDITHCWETVLCSHPWRSTQSWHKVETFDRMPLYR